MQPSRPVFFLSLLLFSLVSTSWADFGNRFIANQRLESILDSPTKKISYRFTCQDDMTLTAAAIFCVQALAPPAYLVSLQADINGLPSGTALSSSTFIPRAQTWTTLPMDNIPLLKGKVYHLVLEPDLLRGGGHPVGVIGSSNYASFLSTDVLNHLHPNDDSPDPQANTLYFDGGNWKALDQEPVYAVYGTGSNFQGNPYDDPGIRPIYGNDGAKDRSVLQGQVLHFHCGYPVKALAFRLRKQGNPKAPLKYTIMANNYRSHTCNIIHTPVTIESNLISADFKWVTVGVPADVPNFPAECYYFVLQTDSGRKSEKSPGCENCFVLSDVGNSGGIVHAADMTFDGGAHLSRETFSLDGGNLSHWIDEFERDANVMAIGPVCPPSIIQDIPALPTPVPLENERRLSP